MKFKFAHMKFNQVVDEQHVLLSLSIPSGKVLYKGDISIHFAKCGAKLILVYCRDDIISNENSASCNFE